MITSLFCLKLKSPKFESPTPQQSSKKLDTDASWETFKSFFSPPQKKKKKNLILVPPGKLLNPFPPPPPKKKKTYLGGNFDESVFEEVFSLLLVLLYK